MNIVSLFAGCGGLDLGFTKAGFTVNWANEWDKDIWQTYELNHPNTYLDRRDIRQILSLDIPDCIGIVGGPPCQSWSEAGRQKGIQDDRGRLFLEYIRILRDKQPLFFLAENVSGMLHKKHEVARNNIIAAFEEAGYEVSFQLLNSVDFNVPQHRKRVIFVGFRQDLEKVFDFETINKQQSILTLKDAIWDLRESALAAKEKNQTNAQNCLIANHEYAIGSFSSMYMSRNRVRSWHEPSFTIQASSRHAPIHPQANKMINIGEDRFIFDPNSPYPYNRLSVRECARIQTFPDDFIFYYKNINAGYKMIGNAVPVNFSQALATAIKEQLLSHETAYRQRNIKAVQLNLDLDLTSAN
nr:DNA cytosine methyltransferase [Pleurocapsa sp. PCC 7319]